MIPGTNKVFKSFFRLRQRRLENLRNNPISNQRKVLHSILRNQKNTLWGKRHQLSEKMSVEEFSQSSKIQNYNRLKPFIDRMMLGEADILCEGVVRWFSKSSGTSTGRSKFIPVNRQYLRKNHCRGSWDTINMLYQQKPDSTVFAGKNLVMGGSFESYDQHKYTKRGDVSAIMLQHLPLVCRPFYTPNFKTALMSDFEEKLERMVRICSKRDVRMVGGVPTWTLVLFRKLLEYTGKSNMLEVWPNLETYIHGGVSFDPYRSQFRELVPKDDFKYLEIYNASEGYFAVQNGPEEGMLLLTDNDIFYEFLPPEEWHKEDGKSIPLEFVEAGKNYAIVITNSSGLWRYTPGDTVRFHSTSPFTISVSGRMEHFINAFGEEVMVSNSDQAITQACEQMNCIVDNYTVAPIYMRSGNRGGHEWFIEFKKAPADLNSFAELLDKNLQAINSDYEAKRYKNIALDPLSIRVLPNGTFINWLKSKGKFGAQNKVPRLSNNRKIANELYDILGEKVLS